jgi:hypothetical protein
VRTRRAETVLTQQAAQRFATERKALALDQFLAEMVMVEAPLGVARELHNALAHGQGQATVAGPRAIGVGHCAILRHLSC